MEIVDALLQGQRGRRLLWEFAIASEEESFPEYSQHQLHEAMYYASTMIDDLQRQKRASADPIIGTVQVWAQKLAESLERTELFDV